MKHQVPVRVGLSLGTASLVLVILVTGYEIGKGATVRVSGQVTRGGKPVPNLMVNFEPDKGRPSWGLTDEEGNFILQFDRHRTGALAGWHTVFVTFKCYDPRENRGRLKEPPGLAMILAKYGNREKAPIRIELSSSEQFIHLRVD